MENLPIAKKLMTGFGTMMLLTLIVGAFGFYGIHTTQQGARAFHDVALPSVETINGLEESVLQERLLLYRIGWYVDDQDAVEREISALLASEKGVKSLFESYEATIENREEEAAFFLAKNAYMNDYKAIKEALLPAARAGDKARIDQILVEAGPSAAAMTQGLRDTKAYCQVTADNLLKSIDSRAASLGIILMVISAASLCMALTCTAYQSKLIVPPLVMLSTSMKQLADTGNFEMDQSEAIIEQVMAISQRKDETGQAMAAIFRFMNTILEKIKVMETIAAGDLTVQVQYISPEDTIASALSQTVDNLKSMMKQVREAAEQVSVGSGQIANGGQLLAEGSTEQASAIQEISASIAEVAASASQSAETARRASSLSQTIKKAAERSNHQMEDMMTSVTEINASSNSIGKIIKVIDDIAFQTNILALNAAVEAARAGQYGKGFAVVAEEVRNLAAKSAEAAKNTGALIAESIEKANQGYVIATETAQSLAAIVEDISRSNEIIEQIAAASEQESDMIGQINMSIEQVAQVVQQNSATAEQSAASSEEMSAQAQTLRELIGHFRLDGGSIGHSSAAEDVGTPRQGLGDGRGTMLSSKY